MKVIVAGSRSIKEATHVIRAIEYSKFDISEVVCGMAEGVDLLGKQWADLLGIPVKEMPANWRPGGVYNWRAGFERNHDMGDYADAAIIVWDGKSKGTKDMMTYMKKLGKPCFVYTIDFVDLFSI